MFCFVTRGLFHSPIFWVSIYFLQIFLFSLIYISNSQSFFHTTSTVEPSFRSDKRRLEVLLEEEIYKRMVGSEGWKPPQIYVEIAFEAQSVQNLYVTDNLGGRVAEGRISLSREGLTHSEPHLVIVLHPVRDSDGHAFVKFPKSNWRFFELRENEAANNLFSGWYQSHLGLPARKNGLFYRMLYLSVVTTTTLGYGDIVPTTAGMRLAIAMQALIGVIVSALFVNSILYRFRKVEQDNSSI